MNRHKYMNTQTSNPKLSPNFPKTEELTLKIVEIMEYMNTIKMKEMRKNNFIEYRENMEKEFPEFSYTHFMFFKKIISGDDLTFMFEMIEELEKIENGTRNFEESKNILGKKLEEMHPPVKK